MRTAVVACGALAAEVWRIAFERGWEIDVHPVPALLHNRPEQIAPAVAAELSTLRDRYSRVAVAYGDCGTYGALDEVIASAGVQRLSSEHCYDVFAREEVRAALAEQPGTYFLTDFLARTFERTVWRELGLDRHPELRDEYFRHYTRVLWLAQRPVPKTHEAAALAAERIGVPLEVLEVGSSGLVGQLERLLGSTTSSARGTGARRARPALCAGRGP